MNARKTFWSVCGRIWIVALLVLLFVGCAAVASAEDISIDLLSDTDGGYRTEKRSFQIGTEEDGTVYAYNSGDAAAFYAFDDDNIMGSYTSFSLEGDFCFSAFPDGLRDGKTPQESPLSFLCWIYTNLETGKAAVFNSIRIDDNGYLYTSSSATVKTNVKLELGVWYNIRCIFIPRSGICEVFIDGEKSFDFKIETYRPDKYSSYGIRYFDGFYSWGVKMKNLYFKTESSYSVELKREASADFISYQTTKPNADGAFHLRALAGIDGLAHECFGYTVLIMSRDEEGALVARSFSGTDTKVYSAVYGGGASYSVRDHFGYRYAGFATVENLPVQPIGGSFELVIRPYVLDRDGFRRYGVARTLLYTGELNEDGYPVLTEVSENGAPVSCTDDTYIWNREGYLSADLGGEGTMMFRNPGDESKSGYRAAYFKFTLDADCVKSLETAASAMLRIYIPRIDTTASRKLYDIVVCATGTDWTESALNFRNHTELAPIQRVIGQGACRASAYFSLDVLPYLREQTANEDGTLTVSFSITSEGYSDALECYVSSKETAHAPMIEIMNSACEIVTNLNKIGNEGYEPWGYAEALVDEWFGGLRDKIWLTDADGNPVYHEEIGVFAPEGYGAKEATGDFTTQVNWLNNGVWTTNEAEGYRKDESYYRTERFARTLSTLGTSSASAFLASAYAEETSTYDIYGGITNAGFKGRVTGFFHTEIYGGRCYVIDPLGNPYFAIGMNEVGTGEGGSANQLRYVLDTFGTEKNFYESVTRDLQSMGINTAFVSANEQLLAVDNGLACAVGIDMLGYYMKRIGRAPVSEGQFPYNNTMNVFDPDFVSISGEYIAQTVREGDYVENPYIFGYTTDNELPSAKDLLSNYLTLNPATEATNAFSYAVAWAWLAKRMNTEYPTLEAYLSSPEHDAIAQEFFSFVYARYYKVGKEAIHEADPNHMYLGSRVAGECKVNEGYLRAAGYYLDALTVNLYDGMNPDATTISNLYRMSGKPFIVTEFYAQSMDAIDANGWMLASSGGAGAYVFEQEDRAIYYEHYVLSLLEARSCVGWIWYRMRDCDQTIYRSANTGELVIMLDSGGGATAVGNTFMDAAGNILTREEIGKYEVVYQGNLINSNQNSNKGIYNSDFSSVVTVYTYDADGKLLSSKGYEVETPDSERPVSGTVLHGTDVETMFTVGEVTGEDGSVTKTVLTVYEGRYVAFANAIRSISTHVLGLVHYFDGQ
ncbi:MAG: hypothetical protein J6D16_07210 [Clostridia bacterium]|nr:hypothetical protein [Clostridia bacterium]